MKNVANRIADIIFGRNPETDLTTKVDNHMNKFFKEMDLEKPKMKNLVISHSSEKIDIKVYLDNPSEIIGIKGKIIKGLSGYLSKMLDKKVFIEAKIPTSNKNLVIS
jgi:ribosomal protein S3